MDLRTVQRLLADAGFYAGKIDGLIGPQTLSAIDRALSVVNVNVSGWGAERLQIAAGQAALVALGGDVGVIDGVMGPRTRAAVLSALGSAGASNWPHQRSVDSFFGAAGSARCSSGRAILPFSFPLAWDLAQSVKSIACHEIVAEPLTRIFADAAQHYGEQRYRSLGLDLYGGCYAYRTMRAGLSLSMHAYGIAVDIDPQRNQLRWGRDRAQLARPEYEPFWQIVEAHGATSLGRAKNYDWMHFQFAGL